MIDTLAYSYLPEYRLVKGIILNPQSDKRLDFFPEGGLLLKRVERKVKNRLTGPETFFYRIVEVMKMAPRHLKLPDYDILDFRDQVLIPGLYDLHFHWVQDEVRLQDKASLITWLKKFAWPEEAKFSNRKYSLAKAQEFFPRLLKNGTVGGAVFSSLHEHALHHVFDHAQGRFIAGQVVMSINSPTYLRQTRKKALATIEKLSAQYKHRYAFTPRFALTTPPTIMAKGAKLAKKNHNFIQTHLSETPEEIDSTLTLFRQFPGMEDVKTYTEIYDRVGILGPRSIMAHAIHLLPEEYKILQKRKSSVAVCPTSNGPIAEGGIGSGLCPYRKLNQYKIPWGLGSDIGAGPFLSMLDVMRSFVSQHRRHGDGEVNYTMALFRASLASAKILGMGKEFGHFAPGKRADFLVLNLPLFKETPSAEGILSSIIESKKRKRTEYEDLVKKVFLGGFRKA